MYVRFGHFLDHFFLINSGLREFGRFARVWPPGQTTANDDFFALNSFFDAKCIYFQTEVWPKTFLKIIRANVHQLLTTSQLMKMCGCLAHRADVPSFENKNLPKMTSWLFGQIYALAKQPQTNILLQNNFIFKQKSGQKHF